MKLTQNGIWSALAAAAIFLATISAEAQPIAVTSYEVVGKTRTGRTEFEYVLRPTVTNTDAAEARLLLGHVASRSTNTVIIQSNLAVGTIAANTAAPSVGTITIRQNRLEAFDPADLIWIFSALPSVAILSPARNTITNAESVILSGRVSPVGNLPVKIEGGLGVTTTIADALGNFSVSVPLTNNRLNRLFITPSSSDGRPGSPQPHDIIQDSEPPNLFIDFPADNAVLYTDTTDVAGRVGDMLSGFVGLNVVVGTRSAAAETNFPANVNVGIGNNGTFERGRVPLAPGTNEIVVTATDIAGNSTFRVIRVVRGQLTGPRLVAVSGNAQHGPIHRRLAEPLIVRAENPDGSPLANQILTFKIDRSDGRLLPAPPTVAADVSRLTNDITRTPHGIMRLDLRTDANGEARAFWAMGGDAGCGNNRVSVTSSNIDNAVFFCASADPQPPVQINIGTGNNQRSEAGAPARESLRAWVSDGCNGVPGVPVTFTIIQGGGKLFPSPGGEGQGEGGTNQLTAFTTRTGHAEVLCTLGPDQGNNLVEATFPNNPGNAATFVLYGVARDPAKPTTLTGLVLDNSNQPIGNALVEIFRPDETSPVLLTYTGTSGQFRFDLSTNNPQLSAEITGPIHLFVYGPTANSVGTNAVPPGSFPFLTYFMTVVPNAENSLPSPALLPRINPNNTRMYYGTNDLELTCEGIDGLKMTIKAGSMKDARGRLITPQNPTPVSLNQVHHDKVPMPIPDGAAPPFAWTLQPANATFDPPIQIEYPNMSGLPAGSIAYFLSFNHDTERFEIVASGHVRPDSTCIVTDLGAGLSVAGWGCSCPPYAVAGQCCNVSITGPTKVKVGCEIELEANGSPPGGTLGWSVVGGGANLLSTSGPKVKLRGFSTGTVTVHVTYRAPGVTDPSKWCMQDYDVEVIDQTGVDCCIVTLLAFGSGPSQELLQPPNVNPLNKKASECIAHQTVVALFEPADLWKGKQVRWTFSPIRDIGSLPSSGLHSTSLESQDVTTVVDSFGTSATSTLTDAGEALIRLNVPLTAFNKCRLTVESITSSASCNASAIFEVSAVVVIDAGHGGTAAVGGSSPNNATSVSGVMEKTMTLDYAFLVANSLSSRAILNDLSLQVFLTRYTDDNLGIAARANVARARGADVFLSIHFNGWPVPTTRGTETYIFSESHGNVNYQADRRLALRIEDAVVNATIGGRVSRGGVLDDTQSGPGRLGVLDDIELGNTSGSAPCRSCLVELEYITNPDVDSTYNTTALRDLFRQQVADAMADAIIDDLSQLCQSPSPFSPSPISSAGIQASPIQQSPLVARHTERLDGSWAVSVNGQSISVNDDGSFFIPNISAADQFGLGGPGTAPDFQSDDFLRLTGTSTRNGVTRYVRSERFQIRRGQTYSIQELTFGDTPPVQPQSLRIVASQSTLTDLGQSMPLRAIATFADGTTNDVTPRGSWTIYRTSNPNIATVGSNGLVTATGLGTVFITAVNDGATAVAQVNVTTNDPLTLVRGTVVGTNGLPVAGAEVRIAAFGLSAITDAEGRYEFRGVPSRLGNVVVTAVLTIPGGVLSGQTTSLAPVPGGITEAGQIVATPISDLIAWWRGDGNALDSAGTNHGTLSPNGAGFAAGKMGQAFTFNGTNGYVDLTREISGNSNLTLSAWIRPDAVWLRPQGQTAAGAIICTRDAFIQYDPNAGFGLFIFERRNGTTATLNYFPAIRVAPDEWSHVVFVVSSNNTGRFFVNGVKIPLGNPVRDGGVQSTYTTTIGANVRPGFQEPFEGRIDEVRVYTNTLSQVDITSLYDSETGPGDRTTIQGLVVFTNGTPAAGATVSVNGLPLSTMTDDAGRFTIPAFPVGFGPITLTALLPDTSDYFGGALLVPALTPTGVTDAGQIVINKSFGLIASWKGDGDAIDSITGRTGQLTGSVTYEPAKVGDGFRLRSGVVRGAGPYNIASNNAITLMAWFKPDTNAEFGGVISAEGCCSYRFMSYEFDQLLFNPGTHADQAVSIGNSAGRFRLVAMTVNGGGSARIYVDGQPVRVSSTGVPAVLPNVNAFLIGAGETTGTHLLEDGVVDEVRVFNRALGVEEIRSVFNSTSTPEDRTMIQGTVVFTNGTPVVGAVVTVRGLAFSTETDASGRFHFDGVPVGFGPVQLLARWSDTNEIYRGLTQPLALVPAGVTDAGALVIYRSIASFSGVGSLGGAVFSSEANAVSRDGKVVAGFSTSPRGAEAFRWTQTEGMSGLGDLPGGRFYSSAFGLSGDGSTILGFSSFTTPGANQADYQAFRWQDGVMHPLGLLPGYAYSLALGASADGSIITGYGFPGSGPSRTFRWEGGMMIALPQLPGGSGSSAAFAISADGSVIVGRADNAQGFQAVVWTNGVLVPLGDLPGGSFSGQAWAVSGDGRVVAGQSSSTSGNQAFRWEGGTMIGLNDLGVGIAESGAKAVSSDGSFIVGYRTTTSGQRAFIWDANNGMRDLLSVLTNEMGLSLASWTLNSANGISDDGSVIVGTGRNPAGQTEAWIATVDLNVLRPARIVTAAAGRASSLTMLANGEVQLKLGDAVPGISYIIEASADLQHWIPISTNAAAGSILTFTDAAIMNSPHRFYRVKPSSR